MTKSVLFFALACLIAIVLWIETKKYFKIEGFQAGDATPAGASPVINVPKVKPDPAALYPGSAQPYAPPSTALLAPPPGQTASVNSYVYEDPAMKSASLQRIRNVSATLQGFLTHEAGGLQQLGDPSATLPLGTARADAQRLEDELNVLLRNPGLKSSLTEKDLNMIEANLGYLQKKWRMSANLLSEVEGFQSGSGFSFFDSLFGGTLSQTSDPLSAALMSTTGSGAAGSGAAGSGAAGSGAAGSGAAGSGAAGSGAAGSGAAGSGAAGSGAAGSGAAGSGAVSTDSTPASLTDLGGLVTSIAAEITRLEATASQDPATLNRIEILRNAQQSVQNILDQVSAGTLKLADIPITKGDLSTFLPALSNPNSNIPDIISAAGAPDGLNNAFPYYNAGDVSGADLAKMVFGDLSDDIKQNTSFDVGINVRYVGKGERKIAEDLMKAYAQSKLPSNANVSMYGPGDEVPANTSSYGGMFTSIIKSLGEKLGAGVGTDKATDAATNTGNGVPDVPGPPSRLDWKEKAVAICGQIEKRGMNPYDFGCMKDYKGVSENFSYRGYAKMVCSRVATNYDPSVPLLVGCPPPDWPGWKA